MLPGPGQYVYIKITHTSLNYGNGFGGSSATYWYTETQTMQTWTARNGSGRTILSYTPARFVSAASKQAWKKSGQPRPTSPSADQSYGAFAQRASLNLDPRGLPSSPRALGKAIRQRYLGAMTPSGVLSISASLLQEPGLRPALRGALYRMLAETPGLTSYGVSTSGGGKSGQAIGLVVSGARIEVIFDEASGRLLGEDRIVVDPANLAASPGETPAQLSALRSQHPGTVLDAQVFVSSAIVTSTATA